MDTNIREHIINNFSGDDFDTLRRAIDEAVEDKDEVTLPGMGVFFEIIWEDASQEMRNEMIDIIRQRVKEQLEDDL